MKTPVILNNRYQLQQRKGAGGMAMVYRARDLMLERTVAIKLLRADFSHDPDFRERFRQEARAAANLSHPNIVTVHDFGLDQGQFFIVMEYVPGTDLKSLIDQQRSLELSDAIHLIVQACAGIGYAHRAGLVHCDVKPQNMLVTPDHRLKVVDFGIARALASITPDEQSEVVWGSPQYFSPEQAAGAAPSPATDVYSLGVVLYEMLAGQLPFSGATPEELARLHRDMPPPPLRHLAPGVPRELEQIVLKVLSKEPSARYRTADQLGRVLVNFSHRSAQVPPVDSPSFPPGQDIEPQHNSAQPADHEPWINYQSLTDRPVPPLLEVRLEDNHPMEFDWGTWFAALLAMISVGGLIPFWLWVYYILNPPY